MLPLPDHDQQADAFAEGLLNPETAKPDQVVGPRGKKANKRYNVYRNNVTVSLIEAMGDIFPAVSRLTGENFFQAMAREFVRAHPPSSPLLFEYGHAFAAFIDGFAPARSLPYLADVARLERAWLTAYHAADATSLDPQALSKVPPETIGKVRFVMHPACGVISSRFAVHTIFMMNRDFAPSQKINAANAEAALVTRPGTDIHVTRLTPAEATFFAAIAAGQTLEEAATIAMEADDGFDLNRALVTLLEKGACTAIVQHPEKHLEGENVMEGNGHD